MAEIGQGNLQGAMATRLRLDLLVAFDSIVARLSTRPPLFFVVARIELL